VHRDIKPDNILFTDKGKIQIVDFGIAKAPDGGQSTVSHLGMGSRNYMAPEQRESAKHVDARADIYSLGILAYRIITGVLPIGRFSDPNVAQPGLTQGLNDLILSLMEADKDKRPADTKTILAQFKQARSQQVSDENATSATTIEGPVAKLRDEVVPLEKRIQELLLQHGELPSSASVELKALAAIADVDEQTMQKLVHEVSEKYAKKITPKQNFLKYLDKELKEKSMGFDKATEEVLVGAAQAAGWNEVDAIALLAEKNSGSQKSEIQPVINVDASKSEKPKVAIPKVAIPKVAIPKIVIPKLKIDKLIKRKILIGAVFVLLIFLVGVYSQYQRVKFEANLPPLVGTLVEIPGGVFKMGSKRGDSNEQPEHLVNVQDFSLQAHEVTWWQYQPCIDAGVCSKPNDEGWGRDNRPVIHVSWNDITQKYIPWLNKETGKKFRLPTEAEWEYAARAGTTSDYSWGDRASASRANYKDSDYSKTVVVKSYRSNAFGLYDMNGNVWEWVQDCWSNNYSGVAQHNTASTITGCSERVLRGGSWGNYAGALRASNRYNRKADARSKTSGFRLAHDL
jgi:formylglycine-generating enzyme required for sulfatase activity